MFDALAYSLAANIHYIFHSRRFQTLPLGGGEDVLRLVAVQLHGVFDTRGLLEAFNDYLPPFLEHLERFDEGAAGTYE